MKDQNQIVRYGLTGLFCLVLYSGGSTTYNVISARAQAQSQYAETLHNQHTRYTSLASVQQRWKRTFPAADGVQDLYGVIQLLNMREYHVTTATQNIQITRIEPVVYHGVRLGVSRVCLQATGSKGLPIHADDYPTLIATAAALAQRPDLTYDGIEVENADVPTMTIKQPCLLLRN